MSVEYPVQNVSRISWYQMAVGSPVPNVSSISRYQMSVEIPSPNFSRISNNKFVEMRLKASRLAASQKTDRCGRHIQYNCSGFGILYLECESVCRFEDQTFSHRTRQTVRTFILLHCRFGKHSDGTSILFQTKTF